MSVFDKLLARVGIGSASIDTQLNKDTFVPGETIEGEVAIQGGKVSQEFENLYLYIATEYKREVENSEGEETTVWDKYVLTEHHLVDSFSLDPHEERNLPFSCQLPYETPITVGEQPVYVRTGLDISFALDPKDKDYIQVNPHPAIAQVLQALEHLEFHLHKAECEASSAFKGRVPFVQEFEFRAGGSYQDFLDELEVAFLLSDGEQLDILMEIDRKARGLKGFLAEMTDTDESKIHICLTPEEWNLDASELAALLEDVIKKQLPD